MQCQPSPPKVELVTAIFPPLQIQHPLRLIWKVRYKSGNLLTVTVVAVRKAAIQEACHMRYPRIKNADTLSRQRQSAK